MIITTNSGKTFQIDDEDFPRIAGYSWHFGNYGGKYVSAVEKGARPKKRIILHRLIMNAPDSVVVDHINGDPTDNRKANLRLCSHRENIANGKHRSNNTSGYKGVWKARNKWRADITINYQKINLGNYETKEEAARAYNAAAVKYFGQYARLNKIDGK